ncbi:kelch-like protein 10 [Trichonephila clavipes]|nr:kelch-like protein 10 [Trichonephila clavipes]
MMRSPRLTLFHITLYFDGMYTPRYKRGITVLQFPFSGKIYIAGGFNGTQVLDSAECYDPTTDEWTLIPNMNTPRSGVKAVAFRNYLYVIGGFNGSNRLSTGTLVERYDKVTKMWTFVSPMLGPRSNFATAIINDLLYVIGGFNGMVTYIPGQEVRVRLSTSIKRATSERPKLGLPTWRVVLNAGDCCNTCKICCVSITSIESTEKRSICLFQSGLSTIASAELYDPLTNSWRPVTDLNLNRSALSACRVSNISTAHEYSYIGKYAQGVMPWPHSVLELWGFAFSQRSNSPRLIEDETLNGCGIINNLIDYVDGQKGPDSLRAD